MLKRRTLLTQLAVLPLAGAAVAAPTFRPAADIEVTDLAARYQAAHDRHRSAMDATHQADLRIRDPEPPEAFYARPDEPLPMRSFVEMLEDGRGWLGDRMQLEQWRALGPDHPVWRHPGSLARRNELIAALDAWYVSDRAAEDAAGFTVANAEEIAADEALLAVQAEIVRLRSSDPAVQRLKLQVLADSFEDPDYLDLKIEAELNGRYSIESAVALSIARDLAHRSQSTADVCGRSA